MGLSLVSWILVVWQFCASTGLAQTITRTCIVEHVNVNSDDSPAFESALERCSSNAIVQFSAGVNYNIWTPIKAKLSNVEIRVDGNLSLPKRIDEVQRIVQDGEKTWFAFTGSKVHWIGSQNPQTGWINSWGQQWYDANPPGKTGLPNQPHLFRWGVSKGSIIRFKSMKPIGWNMGISASNNVVEDVIIDAVSTGRGFPFNTDGIGVSGTNIHIRRANIMNGDDAIAVQNGAHNISFTDSVIGYQTHGMSIGSLGSNPNAAASVSNIRFANVTVLGGLYAARFKSWKGGKGLVEHVT
jgi:Glycosyl hydrolases family 28